MRLIYDLSVKGLFYPWLKIFHSFKIHGAENFPKTGGFIFASNHVSFMDPPVLSICRFKQIIFMAKQELFKGKKWGWWFSGVDCIPISRDGRDFRATKEAIAALKAGKLLAIFPEGTRSENNKLREAELGAAFLADKTGVPFVPAYIDGTQSALPKGGRYKMFVPVNVFVGKPVDFSDALNTSDKRERYIVMSKKIMKSIDDLRKEAHSYAKTKKLRAGFVYHFSIALFKIWFKLLHSYRVVGKENLPKYGPYICASNHTSVGDPPLVGVNIGKGVLSFMAKEELLKSKEWGWWFRAFNCIPISRNKNDFKATKEAIKMLKKGHVLVIFPEGTRSPDGQLRDPEPGVAFVSEKSGAPIIPIYIGGSYAAWPKGGKYKPYTPITVRIGKPVDFSHMPEITDRRERYVYMSRIVMSEIEKLRDGGADKVFMDKEESSSRFEAVNVRR